MLREGNYFWKGCGLPGDLSEFSFCPSRVFRSQEAFTLSWRSTYYNNNEENRKYDVIVLENEETSGFVELILIVWVRGPRNFPSLATLDSLNAEARFEKFWGPL